MEQPRVVIETEQQRSNPSPRALIAKAADDAISSAAATTRRA